jgi:hypothetical protein
MDMVRSTLGPRGMDKLIVDSNGNIYRFVFSRVFFKLFIMSHRNFTKAAFTITKLIIYLVCLFSNLSMLNFVGKATISNDGATIMRLLDIVHPAAKTLVDIARAQDAEVCFIVNLFSNSVLFSYRLAGW